MAVENRRIRHGLALIAAAFAAPAATQSSQPSLSARPGIWNYSVAPGATQATFTDGNGQALLVVRCTRAPRLVTIEVRSGPAPSLLLSTSTAARTLAATHDPAGGFLKAGLSVRDNLLDAMAFSRGRFSVTAFGASPLVVPAWPEAARAVEDCRN